MQRDGTYIEGRRLVVAQDGRVVLQVREKTLGTPFYSEWRDATAADVAIPVPAGLLFDLHGRTGG